MIPFKSKGNESRRSSILKPRKPRQPLQNVNFDSSSNENSPTTSKIKRRVSFAEKKHVKEFCHSTEQGTVWDNTYEEHDFSLKGSFVVDQNTEIESRENASLCAPNDCMHIHSESNSSHPNNDYLLNNQLSQESVSRASEEDDDTNCDLNFVNPGKSTELLNTPEFGYTTLPNKVYVFNDVTSSGIVAYSDTDEECIELPDEESQSRQTVKTNISHTSKNININSSNITIYRDSDEEDNVANKYSESCSNNVNSDLDQTNVQDLSMELTASIPAFLSSSYAEHAKKRKEQKQNNINNSDTNTTNCNNVSMEITAIPFAKSVVSDLGISEQIPTTLQNYENTKWDAMNTHNATSVNYANDSMVLTSVIQPLTDVVGIDICRTNNTTFNTSMEMINVSSNMCEKNVCNENILKKNDPRKNQTDKTEIFNDVLMEMTKPVNTILSSSVYDKENFRMDEPVSKDDRTMFFHNMSMEMTKTVSTKNKQEIVDINTCKSLSEENDGKDVNISVCFNEGTRALCKSMEFTDTVSAPLYYEKMCHTADVAQSVSKSIREDYKNDRTEFFNNASMDMTKSINMLSSDINKENLKIDESMSKDNKTTIFHNTSMEMTTAVSSRKRDKITQPIICKLISKENICSEKETNNSICFDEGTRLLYKSMELTEAIPISLHDERTFYTSQTTRSSQTSSKTTLLPAENSMETAFQTDIANKTIQDMSMEITAAVPSTLQLMQDVNKTKNIIISKNNEFQHLITNNNLAQSNKSITKEDFTISRVETKNIGHNELSNTVTQSPLDNLDHALNANFENANSKKRMSDKSERSHPKRVRSSLEVQSSEKNDTHLFPNANSINDVDNEYFVKNIMDRTQIPDSNLKDNPNEISDHSFLRKSLPYLDNSLVELQSIKPPSFVSLDSEEENSFPEVQHELQSSVITDMSVNNTSNRLIINNVIESKCSKEKPINIDDKAEDCYNIMIDKTENNQEADYYQMITKTIINDNRSNQLNCYTIKNINEGSISSINVKNGKGNETVQDIDHCTSSLIIKEIEITDKDQVNEKEYTRKKINEDAKLHIDIKEKEHLDKKKETEKFSDHFEDIEVVRSNENQIDSEKCRKNLNDVKQRESMEQRDECATKRLITAQYISTIEDIKNESLIEQDPFLTLSQKLETHTIREDCIWNVYYKNIDKKMIVFGFMSNSLLIATFLSYDFDFKENLIKEIKIISRISDNAGILIRIVHKLILEKINTKMLTKLYKTHQDILPMLNYISQDVKLMMDFMFDLRHLDDLNLMEIAHDEISFVSRSKRMDIILRVTIKVKQFDKLTSNDINLCCLLGTVKETDIKNLIKNVKRDHKFLRRYMNDVKDYIDIIEETFK